jgi:hypothetical protein
MFADVDDALGIKLWPVVKATDDVGSGTRLDGRGGSCLDVVAVDGLEREFDTEHLLASWNEFLAQKLIGCRHEIVPTQPMHGAHLSMGWRLARRENRRHTARSRRDRAVAAQLEKCTPCNAGHIGSPRISVRRRDRANATPSKLGAKRCGRRPASARRWIGSKFLSWSKRKPIGLSTFGWPRAESLSFACCASRPPRRRQGQRCRPGRGAGSRWVGPPRLKGPGPRASLRSSCCFCARCHKCANV